MHESDEFLMELRGNGAEFFMDLLHATEGLAFAFSAQLRVQESEKDIDWTLE